MKKFHIVVLCLLMLGSILAITLDHLMWSLSLQDSNGASAKMYRLLNSAPSNEIPILGSSRACYHFIPGILIPPGTSAKSCSPRCYNYGMDGMMMNTTLFLLGAELSRPHDTPIIVNFDPWGLTSKAADVYSCIPVLSHPGVRTLMDPSQRSIAYRIPGLRYWSRYTMAIQMLAHRICPRLPSGTVYSTYLSGEVLDVVRTQEEWRKIVENWDKTENLVTKCDAELLERFRKLCNSTHRPIIAVVSPYFFPPGGFQGLPALIKTVSAFPNVHLINLLRMEDGMLTYRDWQDPGHLNKSGAIKFSKELRRRLSAISELQRWFGDAKQMPVKGDATGRE